MPDFKSGAVRANDLNFHYLEMGEGPPVLCLHGFPEHAYSFRHLLPDLAQAGFRGVAPFMRGYSPTEAPKDGRYQAALLCRDVLALIGVLGAERAHLVGNECGASAVRGAAPGA
jgi:pimeloyl-ACP methyl ester carboxylesterase